MSRESDWRRAALACSRKSAPRGRIVLAGTTRVLRSEGPGQSLSGEDRRTLERALTAEVAARTEARAAHARLTEAINMLPEGILFLDEEGRYVLWNKRYEEIYQVSADLFEVGRSFKEALSIGVWRGDYPEAKGREEEWLAERFAKLDGPKARHEQWLQDGRCIMIEERKLTSGGTVGLRVDITELKQREASFRHLFEANPVPMFVFARDGHSIISANGAALAHYGYTIDQLKQKTLADLHGPEDQDRLDEIYNERSNGQHIWKHVKNDGSEIEVDIYSRPLIHERIPAVLFSAVDVTERRRAERQIAYISCHDTLTDLPNRAALMAAIDAMLKDIRRDGGGGSTLAIGIDHFKAINETLGHKAGDALLVSVARRLGDMLHAGEIIGRLGSDEFGIVIKDTSDELQLSALARRLTKGLSAAFVIDGNHVRISASVGIARAPADGETAGALLKSADLALSNAKRTGRGSFKLFNPEMRARSGLRRKIEADLRQAIAKGSLEVHYQPLVSLDTGELAGAEALVRWHHPERGFIPPMEFIPVAEDLGLVDQLGEQVLRKACSDARTWPDHMRVAVNFSPLQFRTSDVLSIVHSTLRNSGLPAERLEVEITESVFMENTDHVLKTLHELRGLGVRIAMDDFGTGYSSLGYLCRFPFDKIKIDRSFVRDIDNNPDQKAVVLAVMGLGHALGKTIVAEGIETITDLTCLKGTGCHQGQGYFYSRPVPIAEFRKMLATRTLAHAAA